MQQRQPKQPTSLLAFEEEMFLHKGLSNQERANINVVNAKKYILKDF